MTLSLCGATTSRPDQAKETFAITDAEVRQLVADAVEKEKRAPGMVVGIVDTNGTRVMAFGTLEKGGTNRVDADTLFEIGSITKVFTTLLLADMAERGEVAMNDPVGKYLPADVKMPTRNGKEITLYHLATHTSGLPRLAFSTWHAIWHATDPYATFHVKDFYKFLNNYELTRDIGSEFEYSNAGMALLGHVLALRAGTNYERLVIQRICDPLGMTNTRVVVPPELKPRLARNHMGGIARDGWSPSEFPADGELRSSANDMLKFLSAQLGFLPTSLSNAMRETRIPRENSDSPGERAALGWAVNTTSGIRWHDGGVLGMRSYTAVDTGARRGIILLSNSDKDVDDLGEFIAGMHKVRKVVPVDPATYDAYTGVYRFDKKRVEVVSRKKEKLFVQVTDQSRFQIYPESPTDFFCKDFDAQFRFIAQGTNTCDEMVLHQYGKDYHMKRIALR
jgi:D-alanyl-D-alanine-carboxypeptidase/D-alanyl-D-alanine-endopeptidase